MPSFDCVDVLLMVVSPLPTRRTRDPDFLETGRAACGKSSSSERFPLAARKQSSGMLKSVVETRECRNRNVFRAKLSCREVAVFESPCRLSLAPTETAARERFA